MAESKSIFGFVKSASMCLPIKEAEITLTNKKGEELFKTYTNKKGYFKFNNLSDPDSYNLLITKQGYCMKVVEDKLQQDILIRLLEDTIYAFTDKLSYKPGEVVKVFVHSTTSYNCLLIRNGLKREVNLNLGSYPPLHQTVSDGLLVEDGLNWQLAFSFTVPENTRSGLYSILFDADNNLSPYSSTIIISPANNSISKNKKILVLASTNNWQTYNIWGGRSRYRNYENPKNSSLKQKLWILGIRFLPESLKSTVKKILGEKAIISINDHPKAFQFKKLSLLRPHPNASIYDQDVYSDFTSHLALGEWRILAWLEREGFDYDLISGFELHNNPKILNNYSTFILSTHSEYWSKEMFSALKAYYDKGGAFLNLSGNSIYREIEFYDDGSLRCISLRFNDTAEDESKLIGVRFDMKGYGTCAPFKVIRSNHWVFTGTDLKDGDLFAKESLNHNTQNISSTFNTDPASSPGMAKLTGNGGSGWETDKLTATAPHEFIVLAKGTNSRLGGADMVICEIPTKGLVFSASSITFGGSLLIDGKSSIIIKNILTKTCS